MCNVHCTIRTLYILQYVKCTMYSVRRTLYIVSSYNVPGFGVIEFGKHIYLD